MIVISLQHTYDTIIDHLNNGGKQSAKALRDGLGAKCLYRGPDGAKCFIGLMIPDDKFEHEWDSGKSALDLVYEDKIIVEDSGKTGSAHQLKCLQQIHDTKDNWDANSGEFVGWEELQEWAYRNDVQTDNC